MSINRSLLDSSSDQLLHNNNIKHSTASGSGPAHPLHFQVLEKALDLTGYINQMEKLLETPINVEGATRADIQGSSKEIWNSEEERKKEMEVLYNFKNIDKRNWLKSILLEDSDSESDCEQHPITEEDLKIILKIHKCRRKYQKKYHSDILNSQYTYYGAGLLSEEDKFAEHQKFILEQYGYNLPPEFTPSTDVLTPPVVTIDDIGNDEKKPLPVTVRRPSRAPAKRKSISSKSLSATSSPKPVLSNSDQASSILSSTVNQQQQNASIPQPTHQQKCTFVEAHADVINSVALMPHDIKMESEQSEILYKYPIETVVIEQKPIFSSSEALAGSSGFHDNSGFVIPKQENNIPENICQDNNTESIQDKDERQQLCMSDQCIESTINETLKLAESMFNTEEIQSMDTSFQSCASTQQSIQMYLDPCSTSNQNTLNITGMVPIIPINMQKPVRLPQNNKFGIHQSSPLLTSCTIRHKPQPRLPKIPLGQSLTTTLITSLPAGGGSANNSNNMRPIDLTTEADLQVWRRKIWHQIATEEVPKIYTEKYIFRKYRSIVAKNLAMWCESHVCEKLSPACRPNPRGKHTQKQKRGSYAPYPPFLVCGSSSSSADPLKKKQKTIGGSGTVIVTLPYNSVDTGLLCPAVTHANSLSSGMIPPAETMPINYANDNNVTVMPTISNTLDDTKSS